MGSPIPTTTRSAQELEELRRAVDEVNQRLARLEAMLSNIAGVVETTPALIATATDTVDQMVRKAQDSGIDFDARLQSAAHLAERLTDPRVTQLVESLITNADTLNEAVTQLPMIPAMIATATDTVDQLIRRAQDHGIDLEGRLWQGLRLLEQASEPAVLRTLERLVSHSGKLDLLVEQLDALPGAVATAVNVFDDAMRYATEQGVDFDRVVRVLTGATTHLITFAQSREFESLLGAGLLNPQALGVVEKAAVALKETQQEPPGQTGAFGVMRAMSDPDLQRAVNFGVRFGRRFGQLLGELSRRPLNP